MTNVMNGLMLREVDGEPMVADVELAERLGYEDPYGVRKVVRRLQKSGVMEAGDWVSVAEPKTGARGRPEVAYLLNESAALDVVIASRTATSRALYKVIKGVFMEWRRGRLGPQQAALPAPPAQPDVLPMLYTMVNAVESLMSRVSFCERNIASGGVISEAQHQWLRSTVRAIARFEHEAGRWGSARAASADVYRELADATGWGAKCQPWSLLPAALAHVAGVTLRRREASIVRELGERARSKQSGFGFS